MKLCISAFALPQPVTPKEVRAGVSYATQANTGHAIFHLSVMEPMLDHSRGCVLGTPENKYEKDAGLKSESPLIFHSFVTLARPRPKSAKWKIPEGKDS